MFIHEIELNHYRNFSERKFTFKPGVNLVLLGKRGGKSSFTEALTATFLPVQQDKLRNCISDGEKQASLRIVLNNGSDSVAISKKWTASSVSQWSAEINEKKINLLTDGDFKIWIQYFLSYAFGYTLRDCGDTLYSETLTGIYSLLIRLITGKPAIDYESLTRPGFWMAVSGDADGIFIANKIVHLKSAASAYDEDRRRNQYDKARQTKQIAEWKEQRDRLAGDIREFEKKCDECQIRADLIRSEIKKTAHIAEYLADKQAELEKILFEISTLESLIAESYTEMSEEEFRSLEQKQKRYDELQRRVNDMEGKIIERRHLEKNIAGLKNEEKELEKELQSGLTGDSEIQAKKQLQAYRSEIQKSEKKIDQISSAEQELVFVKEELKTYLGDHHQYEVLVKIRQWMSQNNHKQIQTNLSKANKTRDELQREIGELERTRDVHAALRLQNELASAEQMMLQSRLTLRELKEKQNRLAQKIAPSGETETQKTAPLSVSRYLQMTELARNKQTGRRLEQTKESFSRFLISNIETYLTDKSDERMLQILRSGFTDAFHESSGLSRTESSSAGFLLRLCLLQHFTKIKWMIAGAWDDCHNEQASGSHAYRDIDQLIFFR